MIKYLVTGATGFIGTRLLGLLKTLDCEVRLLSKSKIHNYETVLCNLEHDTIPKNTFDSIDTVFHLAGFAHDVQDSTKFKHLYRLINIEATTKLAKFAAQSGVKKFVFISSVKAGGDLSTKIMDEFPHNEPEGIYGESKREAELKLLDIHNGSDMNVSIIRPSLVYGPNVKGNLKLMLEGIKGGWFPPLPEIGNRLSMIHVDDLVKAVLLVSDDKRANGEIFIATDGVSYSSRDIYNIMCKLTNKSIPKWSVPKALFDLASMISPRIKYKLNKLLGDNFYSSKKLDMLGFKAMKSLRSINETDF
jgi:UDP-glucose 4-epimerase